MNENELKKIEFIKTIDPLNTLNHDSIKTLASNSEFKTYSKGEYIISECDECSKCYIIDSGRIACIKSSLNGKELIVSLLAPKDPYVAFLVLDNEPMPFTMRIDVDSKVFSIKKDVLAKILDDDPEIYKAINETMLERIKESDEFSRQLAYDKVEVRIASALASLIGDFSKFNKKTDCHKIIITRSELADLVGTTPETAIRITKEMETDKILDLSTAGTIVILDREKLESLYTSMC